MPLYKSPMLTPGLLAACCLNASKCAAPSTAQGNGRVSSNAGGLHAITAEGIRLQGTGPVTTGEGHNR